jgi:hypothetical protein
MVSYPGLGTLIVLGIATTTLLHILPTKTIKSIKTAALKIIFLSIV